jgi:hypothetical protein
MAGSRHGSDTLDLFADIPAPPAQKTRFKVEPLAQAVPRPAGPQRLSPKELSDDALGELLRDVIAELEHRAQDDSKNPALRRALEDTRSALARIDRKPSRIAADPASELSDARRNAIRSALRAGVTPGQVAKHFGLSPAAVRKIANQAS